MNTKEKLDLIEQWQALKSQVANLQEQEKALRKRLIEENFTDVNPEKDEGTHRSGILRARFGMTRTVNSDDLLRLQDEFLASGIDLGSLVQFKPSLNLKSYRALTVDQQRSFDRCLVVKPSLPTLEVVE